MRIPRIVLEGARSGAAMEVPFAIYRHLALVLRRTTGDALVVFDGAGGIYRAVVEEHDAARRVLRVRVGEAIPGEAIRPAPLAAAVAIPRGDGLETAIRWASEMGLARVVPFLAARGVARVPPGPGPKHDRWVRIAREAAEQCRRPVPLAVDPPIGLDDLLQATAGRPSRWIAIPGAPGLEASGLLDLLMGPEAGDLSTPNASPGPGARSGRSEALVMIGPEGGFTPEEAAQAEAAGFRPVGFPTPVLRTPTAVAFLAALAAVLDWLAVPPEGDAPAGRPPPASFGSGPTATGETD